jgi:hypothetical protein
MMGKFLGRSRSEAGYTYAGVTAKRAPLDRIAVEPTSLRTQAMDISIRKTVAEMYL